MNPPLRFAVIGCGSLARGQHIPNIARSAKTTLQYCVDIDESALAYCREKFHVPKLSKDYRDAIGDPSVDAICLATTEHIRLPVIAAAAGAGKPVYVEKPLAPSIKEAYEIQQVVHRSGIKFCVGHNRRSSPAMEEARALFRAHMDHPQPCPWRYDREGPGRPALPENGVAAMMARINDDWYSWKGWVFDPAQAPHGPMLFEMTHFTDLCNWFLANEPVEVQANHTGMLNTAVIIKYAGGEMATILMAANGTFGYPKELYEMMGQGGLVAVDHLVEVRTAGINGAPARKTYPYVNDRHPKVGTEGGISGWLKKRAVACEEAAAAGDPMLQFTAEPDKGHARAMDRFVDEIRGEGPVVCGIDDAILATRTAFAAIKSAREKRAVALSEI